MAGPADPAPDGNRSITPPIPGEVSPPRPAEPWVLAGAPPAWVRERAAIEMWPGGTVRHWRRKLREIGIETVSPVFVERRLVMIELAGLRQELDWTHHSPLDHALHEAMAHLQE